MVGANPELIKAIALDDEPLALRIIEQFANRVDQLHLLKTFSKPEDAREFLQHNQVDLLFLDIHMPAISGIDFKRQLRDDLMVIFTTAHSKYAVEGFNVNAVDFLLKPFTFDRFNQAIQKAQTMKGLHGHASAETKSEDPLLVRADFKDYRVLPSEISLIEGLDDYLKIHRDGQRPIVARMTMKAILSKLPAENFIRVHRSFIVPISRIKAIRSRTIYLEDREIRLGNTYVESFMEVWNSSQSRTNS
jgi:DNA-binding LytR/AlgR family response regulator